MFLAYNCIIDVAMYRVQRTLICRCVCELSSLHILSPAGSSEDDCRVPLQIRKLLVCHVQIRVPFNRYIIKTASVGDVRWLTLLPHRMHASFRNDSRGSVVNCLELLHQSEPVDVQCLKLLSRRMHVEWLASLIRGISLRSGMFPGWSYCHIECMFSRNDLLSLRVDNMRFM